MSVSLVDPLSEISRKERRMLLGLSMVAILLTYGGALPERITTLGVELSSGNQRVFLLILAIGIFYFLAAFFLYAVSDFIVWRKKIAEERIAQAKEILDDLVFGGQPRDQYEAELLSERNKALAEYEVWARLTKPMSFTRAFFELVLPMLVGLCALVTVLLYAYQYT